MLIRLIIPISIKSEIELFIEKDYPISREDVLSILDKKKDENASILPFIDAKTTILSVEDWPIIDCHFWCVTSPTSICGRNLQFIRVDVHKI